MVSVCIVDNGLGSNCIYTILSSPQEGQMGATLSMAYLCTQTVKN